MGFCGSFGGAQPGLARAARVSSIKMHGAKVFRAALDEKLDLARALAQRLATLPDVQVVEPTLSLLAFRLVPPGLAAENWTVSTASCWAPSMRGNTCC